MVDDNDWLEEEELLDVDFQSLQRKHVKSGYREGVLAGQEYILQTAFNAGFKTSAIYHDKLAKYRGSLSAIMMFLGSQSKCPQHVLDKLEAAMLKLEQIEEDEKHVELLLNQRHNDLQLENKLAACATQEVRDEKHVENSTLDDLASAFGNANTSIDAEIDEPMNEEKMDVIDAVIGSNKQTSCGDRDSCACKSKQDQKESSLFFDSANHRPSSESYQQLLQETQVKIQEIVLDVFNDIQNFIDPLILKKFREIFI